MHEDLLEQLREIGVVKERKRHHARYGPKPSSSAQVLAAFKRARQGVTELQSVLLRYQSSQAATGAMQDLSGVVNQLHGVQRDLGLHEDDSENSEDPFDESD
jgi:hypothetical protein